MTGNDRFIKGADISSLPEVELCGGRFFAGCSGTDAVAALARGGVNLIRLRLWNDPYSSDGKPYGGGTNDFVRTAALAARVHAAGLEWMLDYHYSDFWADPGKQTMPKAWRGLDTPALVTALHDYTRVTLQALADKGLAPSIVAVGNELTNGMLWEKGRADDPQTLSKLINAGIAAVKEVLPGAKTMIHLDNGGNNALYRSWFDAYFSCGGADFDYIGLSYYPFWHGTLDDLKNNMRDIALRYHRDLIVAETSMGFTLEDYAGYERLPPERRKGFAANAELAKRVPFPMTPEGQSDFLKALAAVIRSVPEGRGKGFVYWEPAWIPVPGSSWATDEGISYASEKGPGGNEWANQALFDYGGRALPALETIKNL